MDLLKMNRIQEIISSKKINGISDYFLLYKKIEIEIKKYEQNGNKIFKIAILSSFTIRGIEEILTVKCCESGILCEIYVGEYNQYNQEILNKESEFYKSEYDLIILFIDVMAVLGDQYFMPSLISDEKRKVFIDEKLDEFKTLINEIRKPFSSKILFHNFEVPCYSPLGILENKQEFGLMESVEYLNSNLRNYFKADSQVYFFDYNSFCSKIGKNNIIDYKMYYLGDIKLKFQHIPALCDEYISYIKPLMSLNKKCLVLDLDNTLWGGVIGEDGMEGIKLGPSPEGRPFWEFQKYIFSLYNRGVILAVNSKNNLDDVLKVFNEHPYMLLKEDYFAAMVVNWNDKASNLKTIADEINIGLDSMVFVDDDHLNREIVKKTFPEVLVLDMPEDPSLYLKTIMEINDFCTLEITEEDRKKGRMYAQQRKRQDFKKMVVDINGYIKGLKIIVTIDKAGAFNIPRISQLTKKTNQFNMTTRRYEEEYIKKLAVDEKYLVFSAKVEDKYGDNGITGVVIIEKDLRIWRIDTFLLSCRVLGRKIEESLLAYIINAAKNEKADALGGEFIPTQKNAPAKSFYKKNGFYLSEEMNNKEIWKYNVSKDYPFPASIKIVSKG